MNKIPKKLKELKKRINLQLDEAIKPKLTSIQNNIKLVRYYFTKYNSFNVNQIKSYFSLIDNDPWHELVELNTIIKNMNLLYNQLSQNKKLVENLIEQDLYLILNSDVDSLIENEIYTNKILSILGSIDLILKLIKENYFLNESANQNINIEVIKCNNLINSL